MINWDDIRKQFPVTENSTYLNAAAAGPLARSTMAGATEYYQQMMNDADTHGMIGWPAIFSLRHAAATGDVVV